MTVPSAEQAALSKAEHLAMSQPPYFFPFIIVIIIFFFLMWNEQGKEKDEREYTD